MNCSLLLSRRSGSSLNCLEKCLVKALLTQQILTSADWGAWGISTNLTESLFVWSRSSEILFADFSLQGQRGWHEALFSKALIIFNWGKKDQVLLEMESQEVKGKDWEKQLEIRDNKSVENYLWPFINPLLGWWCATGKQGSCRTLQAGCQEHSTLWDILELGIQGR